MNFNVLLLCYYINEIIIAYINIIFIQDKHKPLLLINLKYGFTADLMVIMKINSA